MKDFARLDKYWEQFKAAWPVQPMPDEREARSVFYKQAPDRCVFGEMLLALGIHAASERWSDPKYIPLAKNWIGRRKWMDDPRGYPPGKRDAVKVYGKRPDQNNQDPAERAGRFSGDAGRSEAARRKLGV